MRQLPAGYAVRPATLDPADLEAVLALWIDVDVAALGFPGHHCRRRARCSVRSLGSPSPPTADWCLPQTAGWLLTPGPRQQRQRRLREAISIFIRSFARADGRRVARSCWRSFERRAAEKVGTQGVADGRDVVLGRHQRVSAALGWLSSAGYANVRRSTGWRCPCTGNEHPPVLAAGVRIQRRRRRLRTGRRTVHRLLFDSLR